MRIAVVGTGGVGGYFGARLAAEGNPVTFVAAANIWKPFSETVSPFTVLAMIFISTTSMQSIVFGRLRPSISS
jgi:hypothetical protein